MLINVAISSEILAPWRPKIHGLRVAALGCCNLKRDPCPLATAISPLPEPFYGVLQSQARSLPPGDCGCLAPLVKRIENAQCEAQITDGAKCAIHLPLQPIIHDIAFPYKRQRSHIKLIAPIREAASLANSPLRASRFSLFSPGRISLP